MGNNKHSPSPICTTHTLPKADKADKAEVLQQPETTTPIDDEPDDASEEEEKNLRARSETGKGEDQGMVNTDSE